MCALPLPGDVPSGAGGEAGTLRDGRPDRIKNPGCLHFCRQPGFFPGTLPLREGSLSPFGCVQKRRRTGGRLGAACPAGTPSMRTNGHFGRRGVSARCCRRAGGGRPALPPCRLEGKRTAILPNGGPRPGGTPIRRRGRNRHAPGRTSGPKKSPGCLRKRGQPRFFPGREVPHTPGAPFLQRPTDRLLEETPRAGNKVVSRPRRRVVFLDKRQAAIPPHSFVSHETKPSLGDAVSREPPDGRTWKRIPKRTRFEPRAFLFSTGNRYGYIIARIFRISCQTLSP